MLHMECVWISQNSQMMGQLWKRHPLSSTSLQQASGRRRFSYAAGHSLRCPLCLSSTLSLLLPFLSVTSHPRCSFLHVDNPYSCMNWTLGYRQLLTAFNENFYNPFSLCLFGVLGTYFKIKICISFFFLISHYRAAGDC